ncbi:MAG TPA: hypothetical protein VGD67_13155, partial [Pseudonocardiaceae bacterium]
MFPTKAVRHAIVAALGGVVLATAGPAQAAPTGTAADAETVHRLVTDLRSGIRAGDAGAVTEAVRSLDPVLTRLAAQDPPGAATRAAGL